MRATKRKYKTENTTSTIGTIVEVVQDLYHVKHETLTDPTIKLYPKRVKQE